MCFSSCFYITPFIHTRFKYEDSYAVLFLTPSRRRWLRRLSGHRRNPQSLLQLGLFGRLARASRRLDVKPAQHLKKSRDFSASTTTDSQCRLQRDVLVVFVFARQSALVVLRSRHRRLFRRLDMLLVCSQTHCQSTCAEVLHKKTEAYLRSKSSSPASADEPWADMYSAL